MRSLAIVCAAAAASVPLLLAEAGVQGPVSGFVYDARLAAIRPVNGMPGASMLGAPLPLSISVRHAAISTARDFALAVSDDGTAYLANGLAGGAPSPAALDGAIGNVSRVVLNATGDAAVLYSEGAGQLQVITGLPAQPKAGAAVDASAAGVLSAMALSADARRIAAATSGEGSVYEFFASWDSPKLLAASHGASAIAFRNADQDVVLANQATNEIVLLSGIDGNGGVSVLANESNGVNKPVGIRSVKGDDEIWVANSGSSTLLAIDMTDPGATYNIALAAAPTGCGLLDKSILVLNDAGAAPLLLADWANNRAVYFVPADQAEGK
jgi:hypothetical protein